MKSSRSSKSGCRFLCFTAATVVSDDDDVEFQPKLPAKKEEKNVSRRWSQRLSSRKMTISKFFRSSSEPISCMSRDREEGTPSKSLELIVSIDKSSPESKSNSIDSSKNISKSLSLSFSSLSNSTSTSTSSSSLSSSSSSLCSSITVTELVKPRPATSPQMTDSQQDKSGDRRNGSAKGLFLLLVSLSLIVLCGRAAAIIWMSSWLCFVARRRSDLARPPPAMETVKVDGMRDSLRRRSEVDEVEEKKRVVFEGFLERNKR